MEPSESQSSSNIGGDQAKDNKFKHRGQIVFRMPNFRAFSVGRGPNEVFSEPVVFINGLPWRIKIKRVIETYVGCFIECNGEKSDMSWACRATLHFKILSTSSGECLRYRKLQHNFGSLKYDPGWKRFIKFEELMDPTKGFYDKKKDAVTFNAEVITEKPNGMRGVRLEHTLLVNTIVMYVNKYLMSAHSEYFQTLFFGENAKEMPEVQIDNVPNAVAYFERLIATMDPQKEDELDDECVEGVLILANRFLLDSVVNRCVHFLLTKSKESAICKFRLAHQFGIIYMKKKILMEMRKEDFLIAEKESEIDKLGAEAKKELNERRIELFVTSED